MGTREAEHEEQLQRVAHALPPAPPPPGEADGDEDDEEYELESDFDVEDSDSDEDEEDVPPEGEGQQPCSQLRTAPQPFQAVSACNPSCALLLLWAKAQR